MKLRYYILFAVIGVCLLIFGVVLWFVIPIIVHDKIKDFLPLPKKTIVYQEWLNTSLPIFIQFWFFSILNKAEVENGEKPVVLEKGPYTYREYRVKENITFFNNGSVSYKERRLFYFDRKQSVGDESDTIITVNIPFVVITDKLRNPGILADILQFILKEFHDNDAIITLSVGNLTWGYEDPILKILSDLAKVIGIHIDATVGLFYGKNNTNDGEYLVDSGNISLTNFLHIKKWRGKSQVSFWNDNGANMINGTDGTMFSPFLSDLSDNTPLYIFQSDICRSIYATYSSSSNVHGIPARTYTPPYSVFANHSENPANFGFCVGGVCLGSGVLNLSTCIPGIPIVMSQPQLYQAANKYQQAIIGLHPSEDCVTSLTIEPTTGLPLNLQKKLQINIAVEPNSAFSHMKYFPKMLLPVMWLNESVKIDDHIASLLDSMLIIPVKAATGVSIGLMALGTVIIIIICLLLVIFRKSINLYTIIINET